MQRLTHTIGWSCISLGILCLSLGSASALSSTNYGVPEYSLSEGGGSLSSGNYKLNATTAPLVGTSSSATYRLGSGFGSTTGGTITLSLDAASINLGSIGAGGSGTATTVATVTTTGDGYALAIEKTGLITHPDGSTTVADVSGTIASPTTWSGSGFGFTVSAGTSLESKWSSGTKYAAIPTNTLTTIHSVTTPLASGNTTTIAYRLDPSSTQAAGRYTTTVGLSATVLP